MDFEQWFESRDDIGCLIGLEGYAAEEAWNARQAEIDGLEKKLKYEKLAYKNIKLQFLNKQHDLDELQEEIDALQQQNQRLAMRLDVIHGVLQKQIDLIVELKNDT